MSVTLGDRVAILGPSGSGKTTLVALLGGLIAPDEGSVTVESQHGALQPARCVAWVLQTLNVLPDRTTLENAQLGAYADTADPKQARQRALAGLEAVGLGSLVDRPVRTLSGGECQRVVIARALASRRPFILADEPTGQLDHATTARVLDVLVGDLRERGIVIVTHDREVAARCDRVISILDGRISEVDARDVA